MSWLDRLRKLDAQLDREYKDRTADEPEMNWRRYLFILISACVVCGGIFVLISGKWITFFIPIIYCAIIIFIYRKNLPSFKEL